MPTDEEDELFEMYSQLADEDARYFREARRDGILYENVRLLHKSFVMDWSSTKLEDVYLVRV
jgi:hypothetical protein